MGEVCDLIPKHYKDQCDDFINKYGVEIVEFLLSSAAPHTICSLLHLCLFNEQPVPGLSLLMYRLDLAHFLIHLINALLLLILQRCSSHQTVSHAAYWLRWADYTKASTPLKLKLMLSWSLCVTSTLPPSLRSDSQLTVVLLEQHSLQIIWNFKTLEASEPFGKFLQPFYAIIQLLVWTFARVFKVSQHDNTVDSLFSVKPSPVSTAHGCRRSWETRWDILMHVK